MQDGKNEKDDTQYRMNILTGVYQYLKERLPEPILVRYHESDGILDPYLEITRPRCVIQVHLSDNIITIEAYGYADNNHNHHIPVGSGQFDLQNANSLQQIFEHIMSKRFK